MGGSTKRLMNIASGIFESESNISQYLITPTQSNSEESDLYFERVFRDKNINRIGFSLDIFRIIKNLRLSVVVLHNSRCLMNWVLFYKVFFPKIKVIVEIHSFRDESILKRKLSQILYKSCDAIVCLSLSSKKYLKDVYNLNNSTVIYNGLELVQNPLTKKKYSSKSVSYAYVGSFHKWQGVCWIADAIKQLGKEHWLKNKIYLIGDGPEFKNIEKELSDLIGSVNVHLLGWKDATFIEKTLSQVDFLLAPRPSSIATETVVPLKVVDSVNYSKPLIASNVGGMLELLSDKGNDYAFFIDKDLDSSLYERMKNPPDEQSYLVMLDRLEIKSMSLQSWTQSSSKYVELYSKLAMK